MRIPCPDRTYGANKFLNKVEECTKCPGGKYCQIGFNKGNYTGICKEQFYCPEGSVSSTEVKCPKGGYYCPKGSTIMLACPPGHFSDTAYLKSVYQCTMCTTGKYCQQGNQSAPTGNCAEGWYCNLGSPYKQPTNATHGGICPPGSYCTAGLKKPCVAGTYANISGQNSCNQCPSGFYCELGSVTPEICPPGYWCEAGSTSAYLNPCPEGTFNNLTQRTTRDDCLDCTPGQFCNSTGE